ncbi:alginate lyase family protein [Tateyamaria sp. syn59]|uniref:alginate lyase family protein n=1 Tax=Tateyamaria sp. syn59 TaxID=2576942 RepID=UPI0011BE87FF|nr:alginate lyase family protein [Tateyamaria sp. syn59]
MRRLLAAVFVLMPLNAFAACGTVPEPVVSLSFDSRYAEDDESRSQIDIEAEEEAKQALAALDDFVSLVTARTDAALSEGDAAQGACVMSALADWARADALSQLGTETVELTLGSRLAALALVAAQVAPSAKTADLAAVQGWLDRRMAEQMTFWETAPNGAASGNLRAWAALAAAATSLVTQDPIARGWAAWSLNYVACTAAPDGSLPQEMRRRHLALHYQVHAITPMVVTAALLERQGVPVMSRCTRALDRIVDFTITDLASGGAASAAIAGVPQTMDAGLAGLEDFQLSWAEAWLTLRADPALEAVVASRRPLRYSKLGGDQTRIWGQ